MHAFDWLALAAAVGVGVAGLFVVLRHFLVGEQAGDVHPAVEREWPVEDWDVDFSEDDRCYCSSCHCHLRLRPSTVVLSEWSRLRCRVYCRLYSRV